MTPNTHIWKSMEVVQVWASKWQIGRGLGVPRRIDKKVRTPSLKYCKALQSIAEVLHFLPQVLHHITKVSHSLPWSEEPRGVATCQNCPQREVPCPGPLVRVAQKRRPAFCGRWGITITPLHQSFGKIESHMTQFLDKDSCRLSSGIVIQITKII